MINKPPPFKGLNMRMPIIIIIPIKGRGFINQGSTLKGMCSFQGPCKVLPKPKTLNPRGHAFLKSLQLDYHPCGFGA